MRKRRHTNECGHGSRGSADSHLPTQTFKAERTETSVSRGRVKSVKNDKYLLFSTVTSLMWIKDLGKMPC